MTRSLPDENINEVLNHPAIVFSHFDADRDVNDGTKQYISLKPNTSHIAFAKRRYVRTGRWYGFQTTYGSSYVHANSNYGTLPYTTDPNPSYAFRGFDLGKRHYLKAIHLRGMRGNANFLCSVVAVKQTHVLNTSTRTNTILARQDDVQINSGQYKSLTIEINERIDVNDVVGLLINGQNIAGTTTRFIYTDIVYEYY